MKKSTSMLLGIGAGIAAGAAAGTMMLSNKDSMKAQAGRKIHQMGVAVERAADHAASELRCEKPPDTRQAAFPLLFTIPALVTISVAAAAADFPDRPRRQGKRQPQRRQHNRISETFTHTLTRAFSTSGVLRSSK